MSYPADPAHDLTRLYPHGRHRAGRPDRRRRPATEYTCACGTDLEGDSRRQAKRAHREHRKAVGA